MSHSRSAGGSLVRRTTADYPWLGEKRLIEAGLATGLVGNWTVIDAVASFVDGRWTFGQRRLKRRSVPK